MSWREFAYLINGLSGETPLGRIIAIRAENDPERLKEFTPDEKRIRNEYRRKQAKQMPKEKAADAVEAFKNAFMRIANEKT